jgi:hypothetical protein
MPPRRPAATKSGEPAAKKTKTVPAAVPTIPHSHDDEMRGNEEERMQVDMDNFAKMNGYGSLTEEEMGWAELLKQGYDEAHTKGGMNGLGKEYALSNDVKTIDVSLPSITQASRLTLLSGQMATTPGLPENQRSRQATHRLVQLLYRHGTQANPRSQQPRHLGRRPQILPPLHRHPRRDAHADRPRRRHARRSSGDAA